MATARGNVILTDSLRFEVLGLVSIALPGPWLWHHEDISEPQASGAIFRCYEKNNENELGYLCVLDVTLDLEEPNISNCDQARVAAIDRELEEAVRRVIDADGRKFKRWMNSHLNHRASGKVLVTATSEKIADAIANTLMHGCASVNETLWLRAVLT
jgi:hypothetical protein